MNSVIKELTVRDIRFPTTLDQAGSDVMNQADYSCAYVTITTDSRLKGFGFTFTGGRGTEIVCAAINAYKGLVVGRKLADIYGGFAGFWRELTSESQLRWLGPEKGVVHLAIAAIINSLWDLWARIEGKPLWKLLCDMEPEKLVSTIDFRYLSDALTKEEAIEAEMRAKGYPAYTTSVGWLGYSDDKTKRLCHEALSEGFTRFKVKVGGNLEDDSRRLGIVREIVGADKVLLTDANQKWDVNEAIEWMKALVKYNITWIEEPTSQDDVLGHATISKALAPYGIGVATGESCQNRVMFKQFLSAGAMQYCQLDSCRLGGPNEIIAVILMAAKYNIPVCPHAGGVGLCEFVQHLSLFDYIAVSGSLDKRMLEYHDHLHEHFTDPVVMKNGCYQVPTKPGYSGEMKEESLSAHEFPNGSAWQQLFAEGKYKRPQDH